MVSPIIALSVTHGYPCVIVPLYHCVYLLDNIETPAHKQQVALCSTIEVQSPGGLLFETDPPRDTFFVSYGT